jgi:hypothetical protein
MTTNAGSSRAHWFFVSEITGKKKKTQQSNNAECKAESSVACILLTEHKFQAVYAQGEIRRGMFNIKDQLHSELRRSSTKVSLRIHSSHENATNEIVIVLASCH